MSSSHVIITLTLVLICSVESFPRAREASGVSGVQRRATSTGEAKPPAGGWARDRTTAFKNQSRASTTDMSEGILFPDDLEKPRKFLPNIANCGSTFCEDINNYPSDYLDNILRNSVNKRNPIFGNDIVNDPHLTQRIDPTEEDPLCSSKEQVVYPKSAKNKDDKWLFIVNHGEYTQGVRIEKCVKDSSNGKEGCRFSNNFPFGYVTSCKQKYIYRKLMALDSEGEPITDTFQLPSCCSCVVSKEGVSLRSANQKQTPAIHTPKSAPASTK